MTSLRHLRSDTANKRPDPAALSTGQVAINYESGSPGLFFKDSAGNLVKAGPVHIGTSAPNATPAAGGSTGNAVGEFWLDTTGGANDLKIWSGSAWVSTSGEYVNVTGDTMTGDLTLDNANIVFEGSTADTFETTLTVADPTADNTITLPNVSGTVVTTGDTGSVTSAMIADATIVNADISASAEIAVSKLADGTARQLLQTDAAGTGVEWTSNIDVPGTLDVTGAATFDSTASVTGDLAVNTNTLFVDASANAVGIGTSDPTSGTSSYYDDLVVRNATSGTGAGITIQSNSTNGFSGLNLRKADGTDVAKFVSESSGGKLYIETAGSTAITVDTSQRVGIGDNGPDALLSIKGNSDANTTPSIRLKDGSDTREAWITNASGDLSLNVGGDDNVPHGTLKLFEGGNLTYSQEAGERFRCDSSGRLLVGTSSARSDFFNASTIAPVFQVQGTGNNRIASITAVDTSSQSGAGLILAKSRSTGNTIVQSGDYLGSISFQGSDGVELVEGAAIEAVVDGTPGSNDLPTRLVFSTTADGASSPTEALRIDSSQRALLGSTTGVFGNPSLAKLHVYKSNADSTYALAVHHDGNSTASYGVFIACGEDSGTGTLVLFADGNGSTTGSITFSGLATAYNTSSDYRLKENVVPLTEGISRVNQLSVHRFNFIGHPEKTVDGFLAHEVQAIVPEAITGEKDAVDDEGNPQYQGIDQSKLVPLLTAALQEAVAKIESLEARLTAAGI